MKGTIKVISIMLFLFIISQVVGVIAVDRNIDILQSREKGELVFKKIYIAGVEVEKPEISQTYSFAYITAAVIIGTLLIFAIARLRLLFLWRLWFFLAASFCIIIALASFIPSTIALALGIILTLYKIIKPNVLIHNLTEPLIYVGITVIFVPLINLTSIFILLALISAYDAYAVWKSKHMIKLAKMQAKIKLFSGFLIPYKLPTKIRGAQKRMLKKTTIKTAILGGGDVAFPLLFTGVVFKSYSWLSLSIIPFTTLALFLLFYKGHKNRFYPAMPFITAGCIAGFIAMQILRMLL